MPAFIDTTSEFFHALPSTHEESQEEIKNFSQDMVDTENMLCLLHMCRQEVTRVQVGNCQPQCESVNNMPVSNVEVGMQVEADPVRSLAHYQEAS